MIKPALARGDWVLCDRFADSTLAYQGYAMGQGAEKVQQLHSLILGNFTPALTLVFDLDPEAGLKRAVTRDGTTKRYEAMDLEFHQRLRGGFAEIARQNSKRCVVIDASKSIGAVQDQIREIVEQRFNVIL